METLYFARVFQNFHQYCVSKGIFSKKIIYGDCYEDGCVVVMFVEQTQVVLAAVVSVGTYVSDKLFDVYVCSRWCSVQISEDYASLIGVSDFSVESRFFFDVY